VPAAFVSIFPAMRKSEQKTIFNNNEEGIMEAGAVVAVLFIPAVIAVIVTILREGVLNKNKG